MAWSETPKGVFDSSRAKEIGDKLIAALATYGDEREALGEEKMREMRQKLEKTLSGVEPSVIRESEAVEVPGGGPVGEQSLVE